MAYPPKFAIGGEISSMDTLKGQVPNREVVRCGGKGAVLKNKGAAFFIVSKKQQATWEGKWSLREVLVLLEKG